MKRINSGYRLALYFVLIILVILALAGFYSIIGHLPIQGTTIGMDWIGLWKGLHRTWPQYGNNTGLRIAPWSLWVVWPLCQLTFRSSWATLILLTLTCLVISVPRLPEKKWLWLVSLLLLVTSYISLRHIADGNFEGVMIAGILILLYGYEKRKPALLALGILLATAKVQETWLFMLVLGIYLLRGWTIRDWGKILALVSVVAIPALLLLGKDWINSMAAIAERGSIMDSSLMATTSRLGIPPAVRVILWIGLFLATLWIAVRSNEAISREKAGLLVAMSLFLSPYMAGNSFLTLFAIGVIPLFQSSPVSGILIIACLDILYLAPYNFLYNWSATYIAGLVVLVWAILFVRLYKKEVNLATY
jgi:hypothetical protein